MGLKKLLSKKEKTTVLDTKRQSARSSTLSLSISNWTHHSKERKSFDNNRYSLDNKRYSQPSPAISASSLSNGNTQQPPTPSASMRDVNEVVNVIPNSVSSELSLPVTADSFEIEQHNLFLTNDQHYTLPMAIKEEDEEDVKQITDSPGSINQSFRREDSDKYQVEEGQNATWSNKENQENDLYQELLLVSTQLDTINPKNAIEIKDKLRDINNILTKALNNTQHLQSRISSIMQSSKETIMSMAGEKKRLELEIETLQQHHACSLSSQQEQQDTLQQSHITELSAQQDKYEALHMQYSALQSNQTKLKLLLDIDDDDHLLTKAQDLLTLISTHKLLIQQQQDQLDETHSTLQQREAQVEAQVETHAVEISELKTQLSLQTDQLNQELHDMEQVSKQATASVMDENIKLQNRLATLEPQLESLQQSYDTLQRENHVLSSSFQEQLQRPTLKKKNSMAVKKTQEDALLKMHTKAQLGLIEYLEGQEDVVQAMASFKKLLEERM